MEEFLNSAIFRYGCFPIGSAVLGVAVKYVTRNDQYASFNKEDMAVGLDLILTACLIYIMQTTDRAIQLVAINTQLKTVLNSQKLDNALASGLQHKAAMLSTQVGRAGWVVLSLFVALWSVSTIVRKWGWVDKNTMRPAIGIAFPLAVGMLCLIMVMAGASK